MATGCGSLYTEPVLSLGPLQLVWQPSEPTPPASTLADARLHILYAATVLAAAAAALFLLAQRSAKPREEATDTIAVSLYHHALLQASELRAQLARVSKEAHHSAEALRAVAQHDVGIHEARHEADVARAKKEDLAQQLADRGHELANVKGQLAAILRGASKQPDEGRGGEAGDALRAELDECRRKLYHRERALERARHALEMKRADHASVEAELASHNCTLAEMRAEHAASLHLAARLTRRLRCTLLDWRAIAATRRERVSRKVARQAAEEAERASREETQRREREHKAAHDAAVRALLLASAASHASPAARSPARRVGNVAGLVRVSYDYD